MKVITFMVCDDIRFEIGQKQSLIGIYDDKIVFNVNDHNRGKWPKQLKIGLFARFGYEDESFAPSSFEIISKQSGNERTLIRGDLNYNDDMKEKKVVSMSVVINNFIFTQEGSINFDYIFYDNEGKLIESVPINNKLYASELIINSNRQ